MGVLLTLVYDYIKQVLVPHHCRRHTIYTFPETKCKGRRCRVSWKDVTNLFSKIFVFYFFQGTENKTFCTAFCYLE